jgi:hypothetical protein
VAGVRCSPYASLEGLIELEAVMRRASRSVVRRAVPVEAFDEGVLDRLACGNVVPIQLASVRPLRDGVAGELAAVVTDDHPGPAAFFDDPIQLTGDP